MTGYKSKRAAAQDKLKCQCSLSTKLVGSCCQYCNPEYMDDHSEDNLNMAAQTAQAEQCKYPDCKCPTENPCLKGLAQPEQGLGVWSGSYPELRPRKHHDYDDPSFHVPQRRKTMDDDDTQVYKDHGVALHSIKHPPGLMDEMALTIAYQSGYYDGKKAAQPAQEPVREALKMALEALGNMCDAQSNPSRRNFPTIHDFGLAGRALKAIKEALAQPAQKPVAWLEPEWGEKICPEVGYEATMTDDHPRDLGWIPLVAQRTWVGLTDEDCKGMSAGDRVVAMWANRILKEKNNG
jgi:hypothetical protein